MAETDGGRKQAIVELENFIGFGEGMAKRAPCEPANAGLWLIVDQMKKRVAELRRWPTAIVKVDIACRGKVYLPPDWKSAPCGTDGKLCKKCGSEAGDKPLATKEGRDGSL